MRFKKVLFIFLALLLPICIFVFLKIFGKNEFAVPPLYTDEHPGNISECGVTVKLPYHVPDSVQASLSLAESDFTLIHFGALSSNAKKYLDKVQREYASEIKFRFLNSSDTISFLKKCVFFLKEPYDLVLVDDTGIIRGEYTSEERDEIDRLRTELTILLKRY